MLLSICSYVDGDFSVDGLAFNNLPNDKQEQILNQIEENENGDEKESETKYEPGVVVGDSGQTTLFGGGN